MLGSLALRYLPTRRQAVQGAAAQTLLIVQNAAQSTALEASACL
jgi:hypothetical protein